MGSFERYALAFVMLTFGVTMILNFSGSVFKSYDANVSSDTLNSIKTEANAASPGIGEAQNRTSGISPEENTFLSPQAFGIIGDILSSAGNMVNLVSEFVSQLGLPKAIQGLIVGVVTVKLVMEALSALFGWDV